MRDRINRNMAAEENTRLTGHPATERIEIWTTDIVTNADQPLEGQNCKAPETAESRKMKLEAMDEVIHEDIDRTSGSLDKDQEERFEEREQRIENRK